MMISAHRQHYGSTVFLLLTLVVGLCGVARAEEKGNTETLNNPQFWQRYFATPASWSAQESGVDEAVVKRAEDLGVRTVVYAGAEYQGQPTKVFAYYGAPPPDKRGPNGKVPGIVLVHGGGGTAFETWVRQWVDRGYAALAMDTCGAQPFGLKPKGQFGNDWKRLPGGGPPGWGGFNQILHGEPELDNWMHQATAAVVLGHSWLLSQPEVDADRTGITGISWGGVLTCRAAGADERFKFAVPVYGCGFLHEGSAWERQLGRLKGQADSAHRWADLFDPSHLLKHARQPFLWVNGTNDFAFPLDSWLKSARSTQGSAAYCMPLRMPHGHGGAGENRPEILVFADSITRGGAALPTIIEVSLTDGVAVVKWESGRPIVKGELIYTKDSTSLWKDRLWESVPVDLKSGSTDARHPLPEGVAYWYFFLTDERGVSVSAFPE